VAGVRLDDRAEVSGVVFWRVSSAPPPERELLTVDDGGSFTMWRSLGPVVGRFAGTLPDPGRLSALAAGAAAVPPPSGRELPPDTTVEVVELDETRSAQVEAGADAGGPWGALLSCCRQLIDDLTDQPSAAVTLVAEDPFRPRLEHRGHDILPLELGSATVTVDFRRDDVEVAAAGTGPLDLGRIEAGPGWSVTVEITELPVSAGGLLTATASLVADDDGVFVPLTIISPPTRVEAS
jgi:hypothetical protein